MMNFILISSFMISQIFLCHQSRAVFIDSMTSRCCFVRLSYDDLVEGSIDSLLLHLCQAQLQSPHFHGNGTLDSVVTALYNHTHLIKFLFASSSPPSRIKTSPSSSTPHLSHNSNHHSITQAFLQHVFPRHTRTQTHLSTAYIP